MLQGLWRMATWHREQAATLRLLSNNFQEPRWKTAAMKNAYALLSRHRYGQFILIAILVFSSNDIGRIRRSVLYPCRSPCRRGPGLHQPAPGHPAGYCDCTGVRGRRRPGIPAAPGGANLAAGCRGREPVAGVVGILDAEAAGACRADLDCELRLIRLFGIFGLTEF